MRRSLLAFAAYCCICTPALATVAPRDGGALPPAMRRQIARDPQAYRVQRGWLPAARRARDARASSAASGADAGAGVVAGTMRVPVFAAYFLGESSPGTVDTWQAQLFGGNPSGSVTDYYDEVSYGALTMTGTVYGWTQLSSAESFYAGTSNGTDPATDRVGELIKEVLDANDASIDFGQYDNDGPDGVPNSGDDDGFVDLVTFIQSQSGAECDGGVSGHIRSHTWVYSAWNVAGLQPYETDDLAAGGGFIRINDYSIEPAWNCAGAPDVIDIGAFCHDFGHALGLIDLYDKDGAGEGIGYWGLMGSGNWNTPESPAHPCAWTRARLGWIVPTDVDWTGTQQMVPSVNTTAAALRLPFADDRFRRSNLCVISGSWSLYCGLTPAEAAARGWSPAGLAGGYGSNWDETIARDFVLSDAASTPVMLSFNCAWDMETGADFAWALIEAGGVEDTLAAFTGAGGGLQNIDITSYLSALTNGETFRIKFRVVSDLSFADDDGFYDSDCGALVVDDVAVSGGGISYASGFESYADGWYQAPGDNPATEYWLVENRQGGGFDASLPGTGLLVWHVDEAVLLAPGQGNSAGGAAMARGLVLEEADGMFNLNTAPTNTGDAGDPYPGSSANTSFGTATTPASTGNGGQSTTVSITGIGPSGATMVATMTAGAPAPLAVSVSPSIIDNDQTAVEVQISGDFMRPGATFHFEHAGGGGAAARDGLDIVPLDTRWVDAVRLDGTINPYSKEGGTWNLVVTNPDGQQVVLGDAITVNFLVATHFVSARLDVSSGVVQWVFVLYGQEPDEVLRVYREEAGEWVLVEGDLHGDGSGVYTYTDTHVEASRTYRYALESVLGDGSSRVLYTGSATVPARDLSLEQNYPNPFNPATTIRYYLPQRSEVRLAIFDVAGALVRVLEEGSVDAGGHAVTWDGTGGRGVRVSSGIYYYRLTAGRQTLVRRMTLLK